MKILITGGAGFIGSHLSERLLAGGHHVRVLDNFSTGRRDNLRPCDRLQVCEGSVASADWVNRQFDEFQPEAVVHAAASYKDPQAWEEDVLTNGLGSANVARAAARHGVKRLLYLQTSLCYGLPRQQPIGLDHPLAPTSSYAISKTAGEQYIALSGVEFLSFRLANVYGPRNLSGPLPTFYQRLSEQKPCFVMDTRRDFLFVSDLIDVLEKALQGRGRSGFYHVASGRDYSIRELFEEAHRAMGLEVPESIDVRPRAEDDVPTLLLDPQRTEADFDWKARVPLAEGVARAVAYYRQHGVQQTYTHLQPVNGK